MRSIFNLPYRAHTYFLGPLLQQPHISEQLYIRSAQFLYNMYNSHNSIVQTCFMNALYNSNSVIGLKIAYFRAKYRVFVLLFQLKTKQLVLTICFLFCLQDPTSHL